jgi:hypothetical protein
VQAAAGAAARGGDQQHEVPERDREVEHRAVERGRGGTEHRRERERRDQGQPAQRGLRERGAALAGGGDDVQAEQALAGRPARAHPRRDEVDGPDRGGQQRVDDDDAAVGVDGVPEALRAPVEVHGRAEHDRHDDRHREGEDAQDDEVGEERGDPVGHARRACGWWSTGPP